MAAVLLLTPKVRKIVNDYDRQRKEGLDLQGFPIGSPRAPMADVSAAAAARIDQALKNLNA